MSYIYRTYVYMFLRVYVGVCVCCAFVRKYTIYIYMLKASSFMRR